MIEATQEAAYWDEWNATYREGAVADESLRQAEIVTKWLKRLDKTNLRILEVGCGTGWFSAELAKFGTVTALDITPKVLERARTNHPDVEFITSDVMTTPLPGNYDVVVALEVLSHVESQPAFMDHLADLLAPGGHLMLATQNGPVLERYCRVSPPHPDQRRRWVDRHELAALARPRFDTLTLTSAYLSADRGPRRLVAAPSIRRALGPRLARIWVAPFERAGWGWVLMLHAQKRSPHPAESPSGS